MLIGSGKGGGAFHNGHFLPMKSTGISMNTVCTGAPASEAISANPLLNWFTGGSIVRVPSGKTSRLLPSSNASRPRRMNSVPWSIGR